MRALLLTLLLTACGLALTPAPADGVDGTATGGIDLNAASPDAIATLPIPPEVAAAIVDHRTYIGWFESFYDLLQVPGLTPEMLERVRPLVVITPAFQRQRDDRLVRDERRQLEINNLIQRFLGEEGASEGLVDAYLDAIQDPINVNRLDYHQLLSYQNVSPIDAVAIIEEHRLAGSFENERELRSSPGLSYWGFRNLREFVRYDDPRTGALRVDYQFRLYDTPYLLDAADILDENIVGDTRGLTPAETDAFRNYDLNTYAGRMDLYATDPAMTHKLRLSDARHWTLGAITHRNVGEPGWDETLKGYAWVYDLPSAHTPLGTFKLHNAVLGNFNATFGQGLVMNSTDFFMPRRTGYGYAIRPLGLRGDHSRTQEFALRGVGLEASLNRVRGTFFYSHDDKDAVLNPDGSFNRYVVMVPRVSNEMLDAIRSDIADGLYAGRGDTSAFYAMRDVMQEEITGANLTYEAAPGVAFGATGVQMRYRNNAFSTAGADRWNPDPTTLVIDPGRIEDRDAEIGGGYDSRALGNYRRIWGLDGRAVYRNVALAAEYGKLETSADPSALKRVFASGPEAWLAHAYVQYENLNMLALYRDYDVGYDNPYNRAFAEDTRYEGTILDNNPYRLRNPYWASLGLWSPQSKAERGWYLNLRYQVSRQFTFTGIEYDTWTRKADGADQKRFTVRAEYRPTFPIRLRLRHNVTSRHLDRPEDVRSYQAWESRFELNTYLSRYDRIEFLYATGNVRFAARGRLSAPAAGGDVQSDTTATRGSPGQALQGAFTHHFNPRLAVTLSAQMYDGFLYNYEDNEFIVVDGLGFRNWIMVQSQLSDALSWRFKWTTDHQMPRTYEDIRDFGNLVFPTPDATNVRLDWTSFRFQLDLSL